jgi:putative DNA primase/helicase
MFNEKSFVHAWEYVINGQVVGYAARYENDAGDKEIVPYFKRSGQAWAAGAHPEPRPLYCAGKLYPERAVFIVEGEKSAQALHYMGLQAVASLGGCNAVHKSDWNPLASCKKIYLLLDNDEAGRAYAKSVSGILGNEKLVIVELPGLPDKGDVVDWIQSCIEFDGYHDNPAIKELLPKFKAAISNNSKPVPKEWITDSEQLFPEIIPLDSSLPAVEPFDYQLLPDGIAAWVRDIAERTQCPPDFVAIPAMVALASIIGRKSAIHPKQHDDWLVIPNLWGVLIGRPSTMKSPAMAEGLRPLKRLAIKAHEKFKLECDEYEVDEIFFKQQQSMRAEDIKKALKSKNQLKIQDAREDALEATRDDPAPPVEHRYIVNDATIEKLGELLNQNPNGLLQERDELTGWLRSLDREDRANDRAFYLECFNGANRYTYDRIGRGTLHIESTTLSIIGGLQPSKLRPYIWHAIHQGAGDDGLIQRFQLAVYPDDSGKWRNVDKWPDVEARQAAFEKFERLDAMESLPTDDEGRVQGLRFDEAGQLVFNQWRKELEQKVREPGIHPAVESHLIKYRSLMPSIALIINEVEVGHGLSVTEQSANKAVAWCEYLESHMYRIYGSAINPAVLAAETILTRRDKLPDEFTGRDLQRKGWAGLSELELIRKALDELSACGYVRESRAATGGRPSIKYYWNPVID